MVVVPGWSHRLNLLDWRSRHRKEADRLDRLFFERHVVGELPIHVPVDLLYICWSEKGASLVPVCFGTGGKGLTQLLTERIRRVPGGLDWFGI